MAVRQYPQWDQRLIQELVRKVWVSMQAKKTPYRSGKYGGEGPPHVGPSSGEGGIGLDVRVVP